MVELSRCPVAKSYFTKTAAVILFLFCLSLSHSAQLPIGNKLIFHSTMDNAVAVAQPEVGSGVASAVTGSFDSSLGGVRSFAPGEHARWLTSDGATLNLDPVRGTVELLYVPAYDSRNVSAKYVIFGNCTWQVRGCWALVRFARSGTLGVVFWRPEGGKPPIEENEIPPSTFSWTAGEVIKFRITWDLLVAPHEQNFHVYLNDVELPIRNYGGGISRGPRFPLPAASSSEWFYVGGRSTSTTDPLNQAGGTLLDVKVWGAPTSPAGPYRLST